MDDSVTVRIQARSIFVRVLIRCFVVTLGLGLGLRVNMVDQERQGQRYGQPNRPCPHAHAMVDHTPYPNPLIGPIASTVRPLAVLALC